MSNQPRVAKVLATLLVSMTAAATVLLALGNNPPKAGPFCLSSYYRLNSVEKVLKSNAPQSIDRWNRVEVCYSGTKAGNLEQLSSLKGLSGKTDLNFHFCICNGLGNKDGHIQTTEKWKRQWSAIPDNTWYGTPQTIRICVIADVENSLPTGFQLKRTEALVEELCRQFDIQPDNVFYPGNWR
ncbi:MAG: peptidoglycan recognition protein family protein [Planctomycetota bacterium]|jgi:hypothetical protein